MKLNREMKILCLAGVIAIGELAFGYYNFFTRSAPITDVQAQAQIEKGLKKAEIDYAYLSSGRAEYAVFKLNCSADATTKDYRAQCTVKDDGKLRVSFLGINSQKGIHRVFEDSKEIKG